MHPIAAVAACAVLSVPLFAQANWSQLLPATAPPPRVGHGMAYDLFTDRVVVFGGLSQGVRVGDTWLFDGTTWSQAAPAVSPPGRAGHPLAFDMNRGRVVLFGGIGAVGGVLSDTWEWDGLTWIQMAPATVPPARLSHPLVYHPGRRTVVMHGGNALGATLADTWEWNGVDWQQIVTTNSPTPARYASEMAYDPVGDGLLLFSGWPTSTPNDTWYFDGSDWVLKSPINRPPARYDHSMATDTVRQRVVLFGGTTVADTWEWDGSDWIRRQPTLQPPARYDTFLAYDVIRDRTILFGGLAAANDTWQYRNPSTASYQAFGTGCVGTNGLPPRLRHRSLPWTGETMRLEVDQLPAAGSFTLMATGVSNTTWPGGALPFPLGGFGMTGCSLLVDPAATTALFSSGGAVTWTLALPASPALIGVQFYNQLLGLDPGANTAGATVSNGGSGVIGMK